MKWGRHIDYHGSRSYERDEPPLSQLGLMMAWATGVVSGGLRNLLKSGARSSASKILLRDGEHRFSLLGSDGRGGSNGKAVDCPFPTRSNDPGIHCDSRVFP